MLTFLTVIEKLMEDEGIEPDADLDDARMMDEELVYIVHICLEKNADLDILATIEANPFIKKVQMVSYAVIPEKR